MFTRKRSFALLTLSLASAWSFAATAADATSFELGSYLNSPGGKQIVARDYAAAIKSASLAATYGAGLDPLVGATNLCVAYTATGAFAEAREACERAVEMARREDSFASTRFPSNSATSRALSNRGVLRALIGDSAGAASDFRAAVKVTDAWPAAKRNLAHLETTPAYRVALAGDTAK